MLFYWFVQIVATILNAIVSWLPSVTTLPTIGGVDIDTALVQGVGQTYGFANAIWVIHDVLIGAAVIWGYYAIKLVVRLVIGHRAPA